MAASSICFAVKQRYVDEMLDFQEQAKASSGVTKRIHEMHAREARKKFMFYLCEALRCSEAAYVPDGQKPSRRSLKAYKEATTTYADLLKLDR